jgi:C4-dicarboxylate transporter DctQ subunit
MAGQTFKKLDKGLRNIESAIVAFGIVTITVIIFINVMLRYFADSSWTWAEELSRYIMVWMTFIGASLCVRDNVHVTMDLALQKLPQKLKKPLVYLIYGGSAIISFYLAYLGYNIMMKVKFSGQVSSAMEFLPMWLVYLAVPIGGILMTKNFIHLLILNIKSKDIVKTIKDGE